MKAKTVLKGASEQVAQHCHLYCLDQKIVETFFLPCCSDEDTTRPAACLRLTNNAIEQHPYFRHDEYGPARPKEDRTSIYETSEKLAHGLLKMGNLPALEVVCV